MVHRHFSANHVNTTNICKASGIQDRNNGHFCSAETCFQNFAQKGKGRMLNEEEEKGVEIALFNHDRFEHVIKSYSFFPYKHKKL